MGGTSMVERCARASTRPLASSAGTSSTSATGLACESRVASASSTESSPLLMGPLFIDALVLEYERGDARIVVDVEARQLRVHRHVARQGDDVGVVRMQQRLAGFLAP